MDWKRVHEEKKISVVHLNNIINIIKDTKNTLLFHMFKLFFKFHYKLLIFNGNDNHLMLLNRYDFIIKNTNIFYLINIFVDILPKLLILIQKTIKTSSHLNYGFQNYIIIIIETLK